MKNLHIYSKIFKKAYIYIVFLMFLSGCTVYRIKVGEAELKMMYCLSDKSFKSATYDPNTGRIEIENFGSETSQVVGEAIRSAIK